MDLKILLPRHIEAYNKKMINPNIWAEISAITRYCRLPETAQHKSVPNKEVLLRDM